jgi:hypothetical protein
MEEVIGSIPIRSTNQTNNLDGHGSRTLDSGYLLSGRTLRAASAASISLETFQRCQAHLERLSRSATSEKLGKKRRERLKAILVYRIASVMFLLFGIGHTYGFLTFRPSSAEGLAVYQAMQDVHFTAQGTPLTYGGFYRGFGVSVGIQLFFSSYLAWYLGNLSRNAPAAMGSIGWVFCAAQLVGLAINWKSFAPSAIIPGLLLSSCLAWAAWLAGKSDGMPIPH